MRSGVWCVCARAWVPVGAPHGLCRDMWIVDSHALVNGSGEESTTRRILAVIDLSLRRIPLVASLRMRCRGCSLRSTNSAVGARRRPGTEEGPPRPGRSASGRQLIGLSTRQPRLSVVHTPSARPQGRPR
jgi:hypothetical protein